MCEKYKKYYVLFGLLCLFLMVGSVSAANLTVNSSSNIQTALNNVSASDVILIENGTYSGTGNVNLTITKNISIVGGGSATIDAQGQSNVFIIPAGVTVIISNINFVNGNTGLGGAIYNQGVLNLINCNFRNNQATLGGAIRNDGNLTVANCDFANNSATHDGGVINNINFLNVTNCTFTDNTALHVAGGIMNWYGALKVTSSTFTGNTAPLEGSAISNYGSAELHFNRITGNGRYGFYSRSSTVNATNNWWGSNNPLVSGSTRDIYIASGTVTYVPWLVLNVGATPNNVSGLESVVTVDLTRNNNNEDTSPMGGVPEGIPVNFSTTLGTINSTSYTRFGKASTVLRLNGTTQLLTVNITAMLDNQSVFTEVTKQPAQALLNITAGNVLVLPYPCTTGLNISYEVNLTDPVTWISVVYSHVDEPGMGEVKIIVNGITVLTEYFANNYFLWMDQELWWFEYGDPSIFGLELNPELFMQYSRVINFLEQNNTDLTEIYQQMYSDTRLTEGDRYMAYYHRNDFRDTIQTTMTYPGGYLSKTETITYFNDPEAGFEIIQSFAIATGKVNDELVQYWLNQNSTYPAGHIKASYGTFLTALTTLWLSDKVADEMSPHLNVTWARSSPTLVMCGVYCSKAYVHSPDASMGMIVISDESNMKYFKFTCSLLLSEIEHSAIGSTGLLTNSTLAMIISGIFEGNFFEMTRNGSMVIIKLENSPSSKLVIDTETGIVLDLTELNGFQYKGVISQNNAYCYHDHLTNMILYKINNLITIFSNNQNNSIFPVIGGAINGTEQFIADNWNHFAEIGMGVVEVGFGLKTISTGFITGPIGIALILKGEGEIIVGLRNWFVPSSYWQYCSYHNPWPNYKTVHRLNNTTHMIDTIEVPIEDGEEDWENAVYISATDGVIS